MNSVCHYVAVFNVWYGEPRQADPPCPKPHWVDATHRTSAQLVVLRINTAEQMHVQNPMRGSMMITTLG